MGLKTETAKVVRLFKENGTHYKNEFLNPDQSSSDFPEIWAAMDRCSVARGFVAEDRPPNYSVSIRPNMLDLQWHQVSVEEHTDDVQRGFFFQFFVLQCRKVVKTSYESRARFSYYSPGIPKQQHKFLNVGDSVIFAPWRNHSLTYFGEEVVLALRSVRRCIKAEYNSLSSNQFTI